MLNYAPKCKGLLRVPGWIWRGIGGRRAGGLAGSFRRYGRAFGQPTRDYDAGSAAAEGGLKGVEPVALGGEFRH
jgi:hypothetical protein